VTNKNELILDFDRVWAALSRSTQLRKELEKVAEEVKRTAEGIARAEAFDEGDYVKGLDVVSLPARKVREQLRGRNRTQGTRFENPLLSAKFKGDPDGGNYDGTVSVVTAKDWKSSLIEFGSLARNPSLVLTRSAEKAEKRGVTFTLLFKGKTKSQNLAELGKRISAGKKKKGR